jgi:hypothetical protein
LRGTVYYNSYGTAQVTNSGQKSCAPTDQNCSEFATANLTGPYFGAATLAIKPGAISPVVVAGVDSGTPKGSTQDGCRVCHAVAADGSKLLTDHPENNYSNEGVYTLTVGNNETLISGGTFRAFPALYPDGTLMVSSAGGMENTETFGSSRVYSTGGAALANQPLPTGLQATLPAFSPDGKHLTFNFWGGPNGVDGKGPDQRSLAVLDFDKAQTAFSNLRTLHTPASGAVSWPTFMPTNDAVVFEREVAVSRRKDNNMPEYGYTRYSGQGELWWVDLSTKTAAPLAKLNGAGYLPNYGTNHGNDAVLNYEPTANPVVSGGYAWVVFTSRRLYGNVATTDPYNSDPRNYDWQNPKNATPKKLWVAAIDLNAAPGTDPSHPAFYLPAQELQAGNARGYWAVDPCHPDGAGCDTGDECCGGYCRPGAGDMGLVCSAQQPMCSALYDKCTQTSDCCGAGHGVFCINGFCSSAVP